MWRETQESKGFTLSKTKTEFMEYKFSDVTPEVEKWRLKKLQVYIGSIIQEDREIDDDITCHIGDRMGEVEAHIWCNVR